MGQRVDQVVGEILAVERRLEAPNVRDVTPHGGPATAVLVGTARHGGDVVSGRVERGGDMPADESGSTGHEDLHVCSKPIRWSSLSEVTTPRCPIDAENNHRAASVER